MIILLVLLLLLFGAAQSEATIWYVRQSGGNDANPCTGSGTSNAQNPSFAKATIAGGISCIGLGAGQGAGHTLDVGAGTYLEMITPSYTLPKGTGNGIDWLGSNPFTITTSAGAIIKATSDQNFSTHDSVSNWYAIINGFTFDGSNLSNTQITSGAFNRFTNNNVINTAKFNAFFIGGNNNEFISNTIHGGAFDASAEPSGGLYGYAFYIPTSGNLFDGNHIYDVPSWVFHQYSYSGQPGNNIYRNNIIHDYGYVDDGVGIMLARGSGSVAYNNVLYNGRVGLSPYASNGNSFYNNTVYNHFRSGLEVSTGTNVNARNNILANNAVNILNDAGGSFGAKTGNVCTTSGGSGNCEVSTATATDIFVTPGGDFHLKSGSPAIDAGTALPSCPGAGWCLDLAGVSRPQGAGWDAGAYEFGAAVIIPPVPQLVLALPLDEGTGGIAVDVSGQKNNANLIGGATWDNVGVYGKAIMFDGTGSLNVAASASLAIAPAMTLEAWVYPTVSPSGFTTVIRQARYFLYASSDAGYCPAIALAPVGGYAGLANNYVCATSMPPINQWSHLAVTYDGSTMTFYLNGNVIASQGSPDPMVPSTYNVTIGASQFGENFIGKIDQPMVYNYARTRPQILSDMSTPLIGAPGKYVEIAAPVSVEISAAASLEISAD